MTKPDSRQRRSQERLKSSLVVKFSLDDSTVYGIAKNISRKGLCINTGTVLPYDTKINLLIPYKDAQVVIPVIVRWIARTYSFYDIMGVELIEPTDEFIRLVDDIKGS